ncbi:hypothetical protein IXB50_19835 [Leptothoe spongobia TAU-MAC 1115]|uniref:Effector-associated domain-containing protein n=1 Tax=Leptothoe spongobia TAU-MAC 1115 TaxID=1967444 RepID=A0A947DL92_9CYAN|nr:hypothetical protein [Leptothoe spongobia TAU-MAC 1115]
MPEEPDVSNNEPDFAASQAQGFIGQTVEQTGKYGVALGQGSGDIHIGDRIYQSQPDPDTIKRIVREELKNPAKEYANPISTGLSALAALMQAPKIREAVIAFRVDFQAALEQIEIIANYKELHDLLHRLEFQCYSGIVQEVRRFPDDETALDILTDHEMTLEQLVQAIQVVAQRETIATREVMWLKDLKQSQQELHDAIELLDLRKLQKTIWLLNRVLAIQPSRINTNLNVAARALRLPALVHALQAIWSTLSAGTSDREKISEFQWGLNTLADLNERLGALVSGHDYWQEMDLELRRIEGSVDKDLIELEMSWPDLKERSTELFDQDADEWTAKFQVSCEKLDDALITANPIKIKRYFRVYRREASNRFYQVDVTLKRLCEDLRKVGNPLASVLRIME